jgi:hypothetical protein
MSARPLLGQILLVVTAIGEGATGLLLLVSPSLAQARLLGIDQAAPEARLFARIAGAALLAFAMVCWSGRAEQRRAVRVGLLAAALTYNVAAALILVSTGMFSQHVGPGLWPGVVFHSAMAVWCVTCLAAGPGAAPESAVDSRTNVDDSVARPDRSRPTAAT